MELTVKAKTRIEERVRKFESIIDPVHIARLIRTHGENYVEAIRKLDEETEQEIADKVGYDAILFYPHDLDGTEVDLDAEAFEVIFAWSALSADVKSEVLLAARSA